MPKPTKFPCPYCNGQGSFLEDRADELSPYNRYEDCGICDGQAMIVVGSLQHFRLKEISTGKRKRA